jgi:hypothetical protein
LNGNDLAIDYGSSMLLAQSAAVITLAGALLHAYSALHIMYVYTGPAAEQVLLLENIATSVQVGPEQLPSIHRLLLEAVSEQCGAGWAGSAGGSDELGRFQGRCCELVKSADQWWCLPLRRLSHSAASKAIV